MTLLTPSTDAPIKVLKDSKRTPPGGWRFEDPQTGFKFDRHYRTIDELMAHVDSYRAQNKLPPIPDLQENIEIYLCSQPDMEGHCIEQATIKRTAQQYLQGAKAAIKTFFNPNAAFESQEVAQKRAEICVRCRHNRKNSKHLRAQEYTDEVVSKVVGDRTTPLDSKLFTCELCTCPLRPKVHISQKIVQDSLSAKERLKLMKATDFEGKPLHCWQIYPVRIEPKEEPKKDA